MTSIIHSSAIIETGAQIGEDVQIGPYCVVGPRAVLSDGVVLHSHVVIGGRTTIGAGAQIYPFASLGSAPQDLKFRGEESELRIGAHSVIREHVTMNPGTESGGLLTEIGSHGLFMVGVHIAHDCRIGDHVIMANNATLGGHVTVGDYAVIGGLAAVHQFVRIGAHAMIGGMSGVENDVIPFGRVKGERAFLAGLNLIGLERSGFSKDEVKILQRAYNVLFNEDGTFEERLGRAEGEFAGQPQIVAMLDFARAKTRFPLCQPPKRAA